MLYLHTTNMSRTLTSHLTTSISIQSYTTGLLVETGFFTHFTAKHS